MRSPSRAVRGGRAPAGERRDRHHPRRACHPRRVLHEREHWPVEGGGAVPSGELPAQLPEPDHRLDGLDGLHVPAVPHVGLVDDAERLADAPPGPPRRAGRSRRYSRRPSGATPPASTACPAVWTRVLEHDRQPYDLSSLRECDTGTSATPPELLRAIKPVFPATATRIYYGSTEAGPATLLGDVGPRTQAGLGGAAGARRRPAADRRRRGVRPQRVPHGRLLRAPDATAAALRDGWYHTGDLGAVDDEGYLSIVGRGRDVLRTGGETVAPGEVEQVLTVAPGRRGGRGRRAARRPLGRGRVRGRRSDAGPRPADRRLIPRPLRGAARRVQAAAAASSSSTRCPARRRPGRSSGLCSSSGSPRWHRPARAATPG